MMLSIFQRIVFGLAFLLGCIPMLSAQQSSAVSVNKISLQGKWYFALDLADEGLHKKWYLGNFKDQYLGNILFDRKTMAGREFVPGLSDEIILPTTTDLAGWGLPDQSPWINYLQRKHKFIGASWFQKVIDIPAAWDGADVELLLERVKWQSRVWVDGIELASSPQDGLVTSHSHLIRDVKSGKHLISLRVDNRMIHPIGDKGHNYTEQTESIWNGVVGKIELKRRSRVSVDNIWLFPNAKERTLLVKAKILNTKERQASGLIKINIHNKQTGYKQSFIEKASLPSGESEYVFLLKPKEVKLWDEYQQNLYYADVVLESDQQTDYFGTITFGYRDVASSRYKVLVNGRPTFIRGNQEALGYPLTGHPPMDVASWKRIFQTYKDYGLNQVRFHSSCPPDAAFQAADELGIYIMVELVWMTSINAKADLRPISATMGIPQGLGNNDRTIDTFVKAETKRILDQFGNHPSFVFFAFGNELDNINKDTVNRWIGDFKSYDNRRLYAGTTARAVLPNDDFQDSHIVPGKGAIVNKAGNPSTLVNFDSAYYYTKVPVIAHELGQYPVYPSWKEISKYANTPFRFINLERSLEKAKLNRIDSLDEQFRQASGKLQQLLYKEEIEKQFRSRYSAGFNLLQMNDYTGQGEALVGWLDAFYDSKGITTPERFRHFCNDVVVLAQFPKRVYKSMEFLQIRFQIACYAEKMLKTGLDWKLVDDNNEVVFNGKLGSRSIKPGELAEFDTVKIDFPKLNRAARYRLVANTSDMNHSNDWDFWVFPDRKVDIGHEDIVISQDIEEAIAHAKAGKKVLFLAHRAGNPGQKEFSTFVPVFWSTMFFPGRGPQTLGTLIRNGHPALSGFPTGSALDWQWQDLCNDSRAAILDEEALDVVPIVQPIDDFHTNRKLASMFETRLGNGRILICGYNIEDDLGNRPAANELRNSLVAYLRSDSFRPTVQLGEEWLKRKFYNEEIASQNKLGIDSATGIKYNLPQGIRIQVINPLKFEINSASTTIGFIYMKINAKNIPKPQHATITIDGRKSDVLVNQEAQWAKVQYFREDFDDNKLQIDIQAEDRSVDVELTEIKMIVDN